MHRSRSFVVDVFCTLLYTVRRVWCVNHDEGQVASPST
jgi:hypothetical protein